jgi:mRNA interferase MazF
MKDFHPLLVLSAKAFNARTGIVIGLLMTTATFNETNPFAIRYDGPGGATCYILTHQPKSFDWRARKARPHPWKAVSEDCYRRASESLLQIIED